MKPEQIAPMALTIQPGTELAEQVETGNFIQATPLQILEEKRTFWKTWRDLKLFTGGITGMTLFLLGHLAGIPRAVPRKD